MATRTIRFNPALVSEMIASNTVGALWTPQGFTTAYDSLINGNNNSGANAVSSMIIYRGTPPTDFSELADRSTRASDVLVEFPMHVANNNVPAGITIGGATPTSVRWYIGRQLTSSIATGSGTATWFLMCRLGGTDMTTRGAMMGRVGDFQDAQSGNVDLIVANKAVVAGQPYRSNGLYVSFPTDQTIITTT